MLLSAWVYLEWADGSTPSSPACRTTMGVSDRSLACSCLCVFADAAKKIDEEDAEDFEYDWWVISSAFILTIPQFLLALPCVSLRFTHFPLSASRVLTFCSSFLTFAHFSSVSRFAIKMFGLVWIFGGLMFYWCIFHLDDFLDFYLFEGPHSKDHHEQEL